jgi:hypothetical protein
MKYLFAILGLVLLSTAVTLYYLWPSEVVGPQHVALSVDGHLISQKQVEEQQQRQGYHSADTRGSVDSLVVRQLLLDEAQRLGIDKEKAFTTSLKDYYEQTLIKVLTDRKLQTLTADVQENAVDQYLGSSAKIFTFTRIPVEDGEAMDHQKSQNRVLFDDLSESLRLVLASLQPGEEVLQFETGTESGIIRLDTIEKAEGVEAVAYDRERVRESLVDYQKSLELDRWIKGLRSKASIVVYKEGKNE